MTDEQIQSVLANAWNSRLANEVPGNHGAVLTYMRENPGMSYEAAAAAMPATYSAVMPDPVGQSYGLHQPSAADQDAVTAHMLSRPGCSYEAAARAVLSPAEYAKAFPPMRNQSAFRDIFG